MLCIYYHKVLYYHIVVMQQTQRGYGMQIESEHTMHVVLISACLSVQVIPAVRRVSAALSSALPSHTCMYAIGSAPLGTSFLVDVILLYLMFYLITGPATCLHV